MRRVLKNYPDNHQTVPVALTYREGTPEWDDAYANWQAGKMPTNHPAWKNGVFMSLEYDAKKKAKPPFPLPSFKQEPTDFIDYALFAAAIVCGLVVIGFAIALGVR